MGVASLSATAGLEDRIVADFSSIDCPSDLDEGKPAARKKTRAILWNSFLWHLYVRLYWS